MRKRTKRKTPVVTGGCLCGAVRYRAAGRAMGGALCHCRSCRRAAGAPMVAWVTFPTAGFSFTSGRPVRYKSSRLVVRTFCGRCGSPLTYQHAHAPAGVDVTTCTLDTPARFPPNAHIWTSHRVPWMHLGDGRPAYPKFRKPG